MNPNHPEHSAPRVRDLAGARLARTGRIRFLSRLLAAACLVIAMGFPASLFLYWATTPVSSLADDARVPIAWLASADLRFRLIGFAISAAPLAGLMWALLRVRRSFLHLARGDFFTTGVVLGLRDFALGVMASALLGPLAQAALSLLLSAGAPAGQRQLVVAFASEGLIILFFAGIVAVIASVMAEAVTIADEHKQFV